MSHIIESDFISVEGYRCVVLGVSHGHRCGYVAIPKGHILYGIEYSEYLPDHITFVTDTIVECTDISNRGVMPLFVSALSGNFRRLDAVIDVHGSLTYSGPAYGYPVPTNAVVWWFGFDCGHSGDGKDFSLMSEDSKRIYSSWIHYSDYPIRTKEYVESHCRLLSRQLWYINSMVTQPALPVGESHE